MRRLDEEVDKPMGSDVPTIRETSEGTSEKKMDQGTVKPVVKAEVGRVTLKHSSVLLQSRGSKKRKSREHEFKLCFAGTFFSTTVSVTQYHIICPGFVVGHVKDDMDPAAS